MEMNWSRWFRCESSFGLLLVPSQPGIFALAEEVMQPAGPRSRRMLAVFQVEEADDLSRAMSRLYAAGSPWREKLAQTNCFVRYAVAPGIADRRVAAAALKNWLSAQREVASQIFESKIFESKIFEKPLNLAAERGGALEPTGEVRSERRIARAQHEGEAQRGGALELTGEVRSERRIARAQHEGEAQPGGALELTSEVRSKRRIARAQHEGEAERREALELKTVAERAVDRVTHGMRLSKDFPVEI
jgi:hypothetical protein